MWATVSVWVSWSSQIQGTITHIRKLLPMRLQWVLVRRIGGRAADWRVPILADAGVREEVGGCQEMSIRSHLLPQK